MKHSSQILIPALAALVLTACSGADVPEGSGTIAAPDGVISYTVGTAVTRANTVNGSEFPADEQFRIYAYQTAGGAVVIPGAEVGRMPDGNWGTAVNYYWPEDGSDVDFYAVYPKDLSFDTAGKKISYSVPADISLQQDVMYETATYNKASSAVTGNAVAANAVPLTFHHALAQIAFKGKVSSDNKGWTVDVSRIEICHVNGSGTLDLTQAAKAWTDLSAPTDYTAGLNTAAGTLNFYEADNTTEAAATDLTASDGSLLLIPQTLTAWDTGVNVLDAANTGCYLAVTCWIRSASDDIRGTSTAHETVYVPFDNGTAGWLPGKRYVYTLNFGAGLDADGKNFMTPITLTSAITDWTDGTGADLPAEMTITE